MATHADNTEHRSNGGAIVPMSPQRESYAILKDRARMFAQSSLIPDHLRAGGPDQAASNCLIALQMAEAMGEMPLVVMQNIHIVKGKAGFAAQYMIARANASGVFRGRINWRIEGSGDSLSATAYAILADTGEEVSFTVGMEMAKAEGWTTNAKYKTMPEVMLRYRSATFLVRFYAPDVMFGYQSAEEIEDVVFSEHRQEPLTGADLLNQALPAPDTITEEAPNAEEGPADDQRGEPLTLDQARAEIDGCETVIDVDARVTALTAGMSDEHADLLREHATGRVAVLKGAAT